MSSLLDYSPGTSIFHKLHPIIKVLLAFGICVAAFCSSNLIVLAALLVINILIGIVGGLRKQTVKLICGLFGIGAFLFILQVLLIREGTSVLLFATDVGLHTAGVVVLRLIDATMPLALMLALTPLNDLTNALVKNVHLPYKYAFTITTALRFIPLFMQQMSAIMEAQTARGVCMDTRNPLRKLQLMLPLCMPLLVTSVARTQQSALAAETRGFYLRTRTSGYRSYPFAVRDAACVVCTLLLIAVVVLLP